MLVFIMVVVVMVICFRFAGVQEPTKSDEGCISACNEQHGDTRNSVGEVGEVSGDFCVVCLFLCDVERLAVVRTVDGSVSNASGPFILCILVVMMFIFPCVMLVFCNKHAKHGKTDDADGQDQASHQAGAHPSAVRNVISVSAHSSTPFASGVANFFSGLTFFSPVPWWP